MSKIGLEAKLYRSAALLTDALPATAAALTWVEITNVRDVTLDVTASEADVSNRSSGWKLTRAALKDGTIEFQQTVKLTDADFEALKAAWLARTEVAMAVMSGDIATIGNEGLVANMSVFDISREEPLEGAQLYSIRIKPSSLPQWYEKTS